MKRIVVPIRIPPPPRALIACALAVLGAVIVPVALASPQYPAPYVSPLLATETEAITRQGIPSERATQDIQVQSELAQTNLIAKIEAELGSAYAGVWFEPATAQLHVGVISPAVRLTAEATADAAGLSSQVVETPVASTWARLLATESRWDGKLGSLPEPFKLGLAPQLNAVIATVSSGLSAARLAALEREAASSSVRVDIATAPPQQLVATPFRQGKCKEFTKTNAYCEKPLASGVKITNPQGAACTAGPLAIGKGKQRDETYVLTAGHCIKANNEAFAAKSPEGTETRFGFSQGFVFTNEGVGDYGYISLPVTGVWALSGSTPVFALTAEWKLTGGSTVSYPIKGEREPQVGFQNCYEGQTTGQGCGQIKALNVVVKYNKFQTKISGLVEDSGAQGEGGDSGGPFLFIESNNEVLMEGILSGGSNTEPILYYTPVKTALNAFNLELLTAANEVRHNFKVIKAPMKVNGTGKGLQTFEVSDLSTAAVTCETATSKGEVEPAEVPTLEVSVEYSNCKMDKGAAKVSPVKYLLGAWGVLSFENTVTIKSALCEITITPPNFNQERRTVTYTNVGKSPVEVEVKNEVSGIHEEVKGPEEACGKANLLGGKYKGISTLKAATGNLEVE